MAGVAGTPDTKNSIVIAKTFPYRGGSKRWTNRYHFEGDLPADRDAWVTLADAIVAAEKLIYNADTTIVEAIGYDCGSASSTNLHGDSVFVKSYTTAGTWVPTASVVMAPGDCAAILRFNTAARSVRNHPVYLMNYYHGIGVGDTTPDEVAAEQRSLIKTYGDAWVDGFSDGTGGRERCGPHGAVALDCSVNVDTRHRDFPG